MCSQMLSGHPLRMPPQSGGILESVHFWEVPSALMLSPGWLLILKKAHAPHRRWGRGGEDTPPAPTAPRAPTCPACHFRSSAQALRWSYPAFRLRWNHPAPTCSRLPQMAGSSAQALRWSYPAWCSRLPQMAGSSAQALVEGLGFRVQSVGFRVQGFGFECRVRVEV